MSDLISRQAAIDALSHMMDTDGFRNGWAVSRANVDCMLRSLPSTEPERKIGHWVWDVNGMDWNLGAWCCSECGIKAETWWANDKKYNPLKCSGGNFCGICGADMRGEQDG